MIFNPFWITLTDLLVVPGTSSTSPISAPDIYIYIYIYMCVCVCVCVCARAPRVCVCVCVCGFIWFPSRKAVYFFVQNIGLRRWGFFLRIFALTKQSFPLLFNFRETSQPTIFVLPRKILSNKTKIILEISPLQKY